MRMRRGVGAVVVAVIVLAAPVLPAQSRESAAPGERVPRTPGQSETLLAEVAGGLGLGFGMSWGGAWIGARVFGPRGGEDPGVLGAVIGFAFGVALGSSLGVHLVARGFGFPARYAEAAAGALAGVLLLPALRLDIDDGASWTLVYVVPAIMATAASTLGSSSRWRGPTVRPVGDGVGLGMEVAF
jgi:hypothetical protein